MLFYSPSVQLPLPIKKNKTAGRTMQYISPGCKNHRSPYRNKYYAYSYHKFPTQCLLKSIPLLYK